MTQKERYFEKDRLYSDIDWTNLNDILDAWERRIHGWYIDPIEVMLARDLKGWKKWVVERLTNRPDPGHYAFTVMSVTCLLIDALSQYRLGKTSSSGVHFKTFVDTYLPSYGGSLGCSIWHYDHGHSPNGRELTKYSEVLWNGYRCGILHQAHAPLYCGIVPGNSPPKVEAKPHATYGLGATNASSPSGATCPLVNLCPEHLFREVLSFFTSYLKDLRDSHTTHDALRADFKIKFSDCFGVDISSATL